jgi:hypothetical protein
MSALKVEYADPFRQAEVRGERIDMGVDYDGTGTLDAIAHGVVTEVTPGGWGSYGNYLKYEITDKNSPLYGQSIYYAEGVTPLVTVGDVLNPGDPVASLIPGWHSGIEVGFAGRGETSTYAATEGGGYSEGQATAAGEAMSTLIGWLGGPTGYLEGQMRPGSTPPPGVEQLINQQYKKKQGFILTTAGVVAASEAAGQLGSAAADAGAGGSSGLGDALSAGSKAAQAAKGVAALAAVGDFLSDPMRAIVTVVLVIAGALLMLQGTGRMLGIDNAAGQAAAKVKQAVA